MGIRHAIAIAATLVEVKDEPPVVVVRIQPSALAMLAEAVVSPAERRKCNTCGPFDDGIGTSEKAESAVLEITRAELPARHDELAAFAIAHKATRLDRSNKHTAVLQAIYLHSRGPAQHLRVAIIQVFQFEGLAVH